MAIVKMKKFTLLAFESQKQPLLKKLQAFQNVEFVNLQDEELLENNEELLGLQKDTVDSNYAKYEENLLKAKFVIDFLQKYVPEKSGLQALKEGRRELTLEELEERVTSMDWLTSHDKIKEYDRTLSKLANEKTKLESEIKSLQNWQAVDAPFSQVKELKRASYLLGTISVQSEKPFMDELKACQYVHAENLHKDSQDVYLFFLVGEEDKQAVDELTKKYGFSHFTTSYEGSPASIIKDFSEKMDVITKSEKEIQEKVSSYGKLLEDFELIYEYYYNLRERQEVTKNFLKTNDVVSMVGWVPADDMSTVEAIAKETVGDEYHITFEDVQEDEINQVPIKLKNGNIVSNFESITTMYSLPRYNEIDPTPLITPFYVIFFGMMVADIGYGLVVLIATLLAQRLFKLDKGMQKTVKFFFWLSLPTIAFGILYGSFFGGIIPINGPINPEQDVNTLLLMSVGFGLVHIFFGLGIKAYMLIRDGQPLDAFFDVGSWVITLIGAGILLSGSMFGLFSETVTNIGMYMMFLGMALIVFTQGRDAETFVGKFASGLYALFGITNYVGDIVSYTRLMALGLAGGSIAGAFNLIMSQFPGVSLFIIGPLFFVFAHAFNLFLAMLGAYVHTCRLQYVEYIGKFYEGGGKEFKPFKTLEKYIDLKEN